MRAKKALRALGVLCFWLLIWSIAAWIVRKNAAMAGGGDLILPSPASALRALISLAGTGAFWLSAGATLLRITGGFLAGILIGTLLAVLTCVSKAADILLSPLIRVIRATPVASFIILILLWVMRTLVPGLISTLMVIPVIWASLCTAIRQTDPQLLEMARAYHFGRRKTLRLVYVPSTLPQFLSACLTAQGLAWKSGVAAEVLCLPTRSVGTQLYYAKLYIETPDLFAWTIVVVLLSFALEKLCRALVGRWAAA